VTEVDLDGDVDVFVTELQAEGEDVLIQKFRAAETDVFEAKLNAEIATVERQLRVLRDKLDSLKRSKPTAVHIGSGNFAVQAPGATVKLTRVAEDGSLIAEEWSVDSNGKPAKLIQKEIQTQAKDSPIKSSRTTEAADRVIKEYTQKDGARERYLRRVYDKGTGKLIETHEEEGPAAKGGKRRTAESPNKSAPARQAGASDRDGLGIDLVALAAAYADAVSDLEAGQSTLARMADLFAKGSVPERSAREAQLAVDRAARKQRTLHAILTVAAENARAKLTYLQKLNEKGYIAQEEVVEAEMRYKMLDAILQSGPPSPEDSGTKAAPAGGDTGGTGNKPVSN
jgi:hypothetical protein